MNSALPRMSPTQVQAQLNTERNLPRQSESRLDKLRQLARAAWAEPDPERKCAAVAGLSDVVAAGPDLGANRQNDLAIGRVLDVTPAARTSPESVEHLEPGRPARPELVLAHKVPRRSAGSAAGLAALLHSIAHIEFNAINLALDAVWRFDRMPASFVADWVSVAADEARHFQLLAGELASQNVSYGDFAAHDGLWMMARRTANDLVARMALVPRVLEARGLDATPVIQRKLRGAGHHRAVAVLQIILDEEVRHVAIGNDWYGRLCMQAGLDPETQFRQLISDFDAPLPKGPINRDARLAAGFSGTELDWLERGHHD